MEPSICSSIRRFISTAYSIGSSLTIGSMKPLTIRLEASSPSGPCAVRARGRPPAPSLALRGAPHRELRDDRLEEAVNDRLGGFLLVEPVRGQVEELLLADLG